MSETTQALFRTDPYLKETSARVLSLTGDGGIILDKSIFYPTGGGQPGDRGTLNRQNGEHIKIATTVYGDDRSTIILVPGEGQSELQTGETVSLALDWERRYRHMQVHTALHLLCSLIPFPVTGGQISDKGGRLDFDIDQPDAVQRDQLTEKLRRLIDEDHRVQERWISDAELDANPQMVRTMRVQPPRGSGQIRLIEIGDRDQPIDLQPCGGTHVRSTGEIGLVSIDKIEKKGKQNRRVRLSLN